MKIFNKINKKEQIEKWIDWCEIPIEIVIPPWGEHIPKGQFNPNKKIIIINGKQNDKEIIKSIIHEIGHWKNNHQVNDPNIWENENHCIEIEKQWKVEPDDVVW